MDKYGVMVVVELEFEVFRGCYCIVLIVDILMRSVCDMLQDVMVEKEIEKKEIYVDSIMNIMQFLLIEFEGSKLIYDLYELDGKNWVRIKVVLFVIFCEVLIIFSDVNIDVYVLFLNICWIFGNL